MSDEICRCEKIPGTLIEVNFVKIPQCKKCRGFVVVGKKDGISLIKCPQCGEMIPIPRPGESDSVCPCGMKAIAEIAWIETI